MSDAAFLGYAHGAAGIGDVLLDLFDATGRPEFADQAARVAVELRAAAVAVRGDGLDWPARVGERPRSTFWCHGAAGVGKFWVHAARAGIAPDGFDLARAAARAVASRIRSAGPTQCHGLAGNIEFLLDLHQETGDPQHLAKAREFGVLLLAFRRQVAGRVVFPTDSPDAFSPDLAVGFAGVATCLLRLSDPGQRPDAVSRAGLSGGAPRRSVSPGR